MEDFIAKFFGLIAAGVAAVVWLIRLESVDLGNRKEIARL